MTRSHFHHHWSLNKILQVLKICCLFHRGIHICLEVGDQSCSIDAWSNLSHDKTPLLSALVSIKVFWLIIIYHRLKRRPPKSRIVLSSTRYQNANEGGSFLLISRGEIFHWQILQLKSVENLLTNGGTSFFSEIFARKNKLLGYFSTILALLWGVVLVFLTPFLCGKHVVINN